MKRYKDTTNQSL